MLRGSKKYWFIAIIFGLIVTGLFYVYLKQIKTAYTPRDLMQVVKAAQNIPKDTVINQNHIVIEQIPAQYVHNDAIRDKSAVLGKVATSPIFKGEQVLNQNLLSSSDREQRIAYSVPENKRAMSVAVTSVSGVSGYVQAGDRVDVISVLDFKAAGASEAIPYSVVVLQDIQVLSVGENAVINADKKAQEAAGKTVTLAVSVPEAQRLMLAAEKGAIRLLLRSPVDKGTVVPAPFQGADFLK